MISSRADNSAIETPFVPDIGALTPGDTVMAALYYAHAGFHVLPVRIGKHPGSIVGKGWDKKSSRDSLQIERWWNEYPEAGVSLHTGKSNVVAFDLDCDEIPEELIWLKTGVFQQTRPGGQRGHYVFASREWWVSGDLKLKDGTTVGDIKSGNSVIMAEPSQHSAGGHYRWRTTGIVPPLPPQAFDYLTPLGATRAGSRSVEATDAQVSQAISDWIGSDRPKVLDNLVNSLRNARSGTRNLALRLTKVAAGEARIGFYPLETAREKFEDAMRESYEKRQEPGKFDFHEFERLWKDAVGYALSRSFEEIEAEANRPYGEDSRKMNNVTPIKFEAGDGIDPNVLTELNKMKVRAEANRLFDSEAHKPFERTQRNLTKFLADPPQLVPMRIENIMPDGGRIVFAAPYKTGKTTIVANLMRSLVDGDLFLDTFPVFKKAERLVLIDDELSEDMVRNWLMTQNIRNTDAVVDVICVRGQVSSFDILNDKGRADWASYLRDLGCDYLILDCLRPVLDALGLNENQDAGKFLTAFDTLLFEAGTPGDATIVHHMGHANERSRGDSRIQDWPDAIWKIVREDPDDELSPRYFSASGRDVEVAQGKLKYDPATRRLSYQGVSRSDAKKQRRLEPALKAALDVLTDDKNNGGTGIGKTSLIGKVHNATGIGRPTIEEALNFGEKELHITTFKGLKNATMYLPGPVAWTP
jgi:hypothetical protein